MLPSRATGTGETTTTVTRVILDVLAELALALAVPAYMVALAAVVLAFQCPRRRADAR
ncbi:MAG: hypothetical protein ACRDRZ_11850 [Pseudonocardiaceae bacterium]